MRQCLQCGFSSPDYSQYCSNCGSSLTVANRTPTTQASAQPPTDVRRRKYRVFIPGLGVFGFFHRDPQTGQWGCGPGCLISAILAVVIAFGSFQLLQHSAPVAKLITNPVSGSVVPGRSIQVHGSNFPPDSIVKITVDGAPAASLTMSGSAYIENLFTKERQTHPLDHTVIVSSNGTFDTTILVPSSWIPGSHHTIQATTQNAQASMQASIDVETQSSGQPSTVPSSAVPTTAPDVPPVTVPDVPPVTMPIVSGITPTSGPASGGTSIMLSGVYFSNATSVSFGSTPANSFTVDSDTQITAVSPAGNSGTAGVTVTTAGGTSIASSNDQFTYIPLPVVSSISPASSTSTQTVTITGSGFTGTTSVFFGSVPADSFTVDSDVQITAVTTFQKLPQGMNTVDVTVTTAGGTSATNSNDQFLYYIVG